MNDISILRWQAGVETEIEGAATYAQHFCRFKLAPGIGIRQYRLEHEREPTANGCLPPDFKIIGKGSIIKRAMLRAVT